MALYIDSAFLHDIMNLDMLTDPLTEEAIERFTQDWQKMNKL
jgi:transaldolase